MNNSKMKKILAKDKKVRKLVKKFEKQRFVLKSICNNSNFNSLIKLNAFYKLSVLSRYSSKSFISNRCVLTINKKKFNKLTNFSRIVFLKLVKHRNLHGLQKIYW